MRVDFWTVLRNSSRNRADPGGDECEFTLPMATTEGCLVGNADRGCKAIYAGEYEWVVSERRHEILMLHVREEKNVIHNLELSLKLLEKTNRIIFKI